MELKEAKTKEQFQEEAKTYVINMQNNSRKLHKKNCCGSSKWIKKYYDFDSLDELKKASVEFDECRNCFIGSNEEIPSVSRIASTTVLVEKRKTHTSATSVILKLSTLFGLIWALYFMSVQMADNVENYRSSLILIGVLFSAIFFTIDMFRGKRPLTLYGDRLEGFASNIHQEKVIYLSNIAYIEKNYRHNGMKTLTITTKSNEFYEFTEIANIDEFCDKICEMKNQDKKFQGLFVRPSIFSKNKRVGTIVAIVAIIIFIFIVVRTIVNHEPSKNYTETERENHKWAHDVKEWIDTNGEYYR